MIESNSYCNNNFEKSKPNLNIWKQNIQNSILWSSSIQAIISHPHFLMDSYHFSSTVFQNITIIVRFSKKITILWYRDTAPLKTTLVWLLMITLPPLAFDGTFLFADWRNFTAAGVNFTVILR